MPKYFFLSGQHPQLSKKEITAILGEKSIETSLNSGQIVEADLPDNIIDYLGGTVKIAEIIGSAKKDFHSTLNQITKILSSYSKPTFAISPLKLDHLDLPDAKEVKKHLKAEFGLSSRYRESGNFGVASAALLSKSDLIEILIIDNDQDLILAKTIATQDINQWTMRDRERPYYDRKKGMLPPKVARIMVNFALSGKKPEETTIYDPFCGTGTVLQEALLADANVVGSDQDPEAILGCKRNLDWLETKYEFPGTSYLEVADVSKFKPQQKIDLIVTEPFLGKPKPNPDFLPKMFSGLERLYLGAFKNWAKFLPENAKVVIVFPYVKLEHKAYSLEVLIDKLEKIGYTPVSEPLIYGRPNAVTKRQIFEFIYNSKSKKE